ncbi:Glycosyl transferase family 2 [Clostridium cavendishii DSM 21758]|uniref:Glycosyl transferase family 2 n=1 Tax=Clostridium cavendishii DSM 21758 TaxID=1121302 RepID=A0A1M6IXU9_9CLOT|nr:glycosyltransferase [Clostridium cavendishii]SHJ39270.1 Glycosyl transferase family 2 [Clostridium cavendishii DSM 21758]
MDSLDSTNKKININLKQNDKVSVIIPTYNGKEYIAETIESILSQDYPNMEIIITDNCSTDGTENVVKNYLKDKRIKYIRNDKNMGMHYNYNNAFYNYANGKYVKIIDHDDYLIDNSFISKAVSMFDENENLSLVFAKCKNLYMDSGKLIGINLQNDKVTPGLEYFLNYEKSYKYGHITSVVTSLFNKDKLKEVNCFKENSTYKDLFLYLNAMLVGDIGFIDSYCGVYRVYKTSGTYQINDTEINIIEKLEHDNSTILALEDLKIKAKKKYGLSDQEALEWINFRVMKVIFYRINILIELNLYNHIDLLLDNIKNDYFSAYLSLKRYINNISQQNKN